MRTPSTLLMSAVLLFGAGAASATNLIQNPGFEQGALGWEYEHFAFFNSPLWAHTGPGVARLTYCSNVGPCLDDIFSGAYVGQLVATTPGQFYDMSFWVRSFAGDSRISVFWDGVELLQTTSPNGPMVQYTLSGLTASANASYLEVHAYNGTDKHMSFDDFSLVQVAPATLMTPPAPVVEVPEPGSGALLLAALGAMVFVQRRRG